MKSTLSIPSPTTPAAPGARPVVNISMGPTEWLLLGLLSMIWGGSFFFLISVSAILLGVLVLGERLGWNALGGMSLIFTGLIAIDGRLLKSGRLKLVNRIHHSQNGGAGNMIPARNCPGGKRRS